MSLHIVIGFPERGSAAEPVPVYVGESATAAEAAMAENTSCARFERFSNVTGIRKHNARYVRPELAPVAESEAEARTGRRKRPLK